MPSRLKTLELHGYKTFASRTEFSFAGMITAIVGPNGSGKSNIADSIRWVLGEQSYSLLRAKKTEDMIFSGSEQKPRSGMASATIIFDNSDGWLPIDFTDVAITRRAYRDGQNEYLINGQRVRLRDVSELLAQSGLAERTYTIIGQGLVDAALALRAEDRRRLFEEAAGIGLHRSRKEEALRRLDSTRRNLERVQDILAELQPRVRSLERQSRRVREYEQVKSDLHLVLREWYGYHWHRAQKDLADTQIIAQNQENTLDRSRINQDGLDQEMRELVGNLSSQRDQLSTWHRELSGLHLKQEQLSRDIVVGEERFRSYTNQKNDIASEFTRLEEESLLQSELSDSAMDYIESLRSELHEATNKVQELNVAFREKQAIRDEAEAKVQEARQELSALTSRKENIRALIQERKSIAESNRLLLVNIEKGVQDKTSEKEIVEERLHKINDNLLEIASANAESQNQINSIKIELDRIDINKKQLNELLTIVRTDSARMMAQMNVLDQADRSLSGYTSGARLLLQAKQQSRIQGIVGAMSSQIEVQEIHEIAIASALGEYLDAVIFENRDHIDEALQLLEGTQVRSALLPMEVFHKSSEESLSDILSSADGVIGIASELVSVSTDMKSLVNLMLDSVLVVENRQNARKVIEEFRVRNLSGWRVVTLRGELFHIWGGILAGQEGKPGTLSRLRERRELQRKIEEVRQNSEDLQNQVNDLDSRIADNQSRLAKVNENFLVLENQQKNARELQLKEELVLQKILQDITWQKERAASIDGLIIKGEKEIELVEVEFESLDEAIDKARKDLRKQITTHAELSMDEVQSHLTHWVTRQAVANQAVEDASKRIDELQSSLKRTKTAMDSLRLRTDNIEKQIYQLTIEKEHAVLAEEEVSQQINLLQEKIQPVELNLLDLEKKYVDLQREEARSRQTLSNNEHLNAQARISLARKQEALNSLRSRIEDDFGLVSFRYADNVSGQTTLPLEGLVEQLPVIVEIPAELEENVKRYRNQLRRIGPVNLEVQDEYKQVNDRYEFLTEQVADLRKAEEDIKEVIAELDLLMEREFGKTFNAVAQEFKQIFTRLFGGGAARLVLTSPDNIADTGIDIEARLPGRREQGLSLLSGGERSLTAAALVFSLLRVSPTPFCVLDEVDAMLDEANVGRFRDLLSELSQHTQFVIVTHNRNTVQAAEVIYGVTMGQDSTSRVISLKLDEVDQVVDN